MRGDALDRIGEAASLLTSMAAAGTGWLDRVVNRIDDRVQTKHHARRYRNEGGKAPTAAEREQLRRFALRQGGKR